MARLNYFSVLVFCLCFVVSEAFASDQLPRVDIVASEARFYNIRLYQENDNTWVLRGRITRSDKDTKVPTGKVKVVVYDGQGRRGYMTTSDYKPGFIHRKTKRASYFTIRLPRRAVTNKSYLKLSFTR